MALRISIKTILLWLFFTINGCTESDKRLEPDAALPEYSCTKEQLELVQIEFAICSKSNFYSSYCFKQAKISICTKNNKKPEKGCEK